MRKRHEIHQLARIEFLEPSVRVGLVHLLLSIAEELHNSKKMMTNLHTPEVKNLIYGFSKLPSSNQHHPLSNPYFQRDGIMAIHGRATSVA